MLSLSSGGGDGNSHNPTIMTDSNVLRLIRRYDPVGVSTGSIRTRRSLENTRNAYHTNPSKSLSSLPLNATSSLSSVLPQRTSTSIHENNNLVRQPSTPRLQRQKAIHEQEPPSPPSPPLPSPNVTNSIRPILKYTSPTARAPLNVQSNKTQPLTIEVEPHVSPTITNEHTITYQPLITTGTKRVCAAISKSEWDIRLQNDSLSPIATPPPPLPTPPTIPIRPPSPRTTINQQQEKESYRPLLGRSKSSVGINIKNNEQDNEIDDFDENSAPITTGSCVNKLKQLFITKSSLHLTNSPINKQDPVSPMESNLNRPLNTNETNINKPDLNLSTPSLSQKVPNSNSIETQAQTIPNGNLTKPTTIIQEAIPASSPLFKRPIIKSQKTFDGYVEIIFLIDKYRNDKNRKKGKRK
jgi:hypothetical protein